MAAETAVAFGLQVDPLYDLALAVAAQHPGARTCAAHEEAAVRFRHETVRTARQRDLVAEGEAARLPVGDQGAGKVGVVGTRAAPGGAYHGAGATGCRADMAGEGGGGD